MGRRRRDKIQEIAFLHSNYFIRLESEVKGKKKE